MSVDCNGCVVYGKMVSNEELEWLREKYKDVWDYFDNHDFLELVTVNSYSDRDENHILGVYTVYCHDSPDIINKNELYLSPTEEREIEDEIRKIFNYPNANVDCEYWCFNRWW